MYNIIYKYSDMLINIVRKNECYSVTHYNFFFTCENKRTNIKTVSIQISQK